jgi:hypothetical protein
MGQSCWLHATAGRSLALGSFFFYVLLALRCPLDFPSGTHNQNVGQIREVNVKLPNLATKPDVDVRFDFVEPVPDTQHCLIQNSYEQNMR